MQLVVIGTGLMGGSFALAARAHGVFDRILGIEPDPEARDRALADGLVDQMVESVPEQTDAVLLAGPSHTVAAWVVTLAEHPALVLDIASVKAAVLDEVRARLGTVPARFVPCHPLTGSEQSGPGSANARLFEAAPLIVTPVAETDPAALARVEAWWRQVGAEVMTMDAAEHDRVLARTSHLPHLLAFAYLQRLEDAELAYTAGGFRDFTRIAAADARVWAPIFQLNRGPLLAALDDVEAELRRFRGLLEAGDDAALAAFIQAAARRRRGLGGRA